jgi:hypothetical protein
MIEPPVIGQISMRNANAYFGRLAMTNYYQLFITNGGWLDPNNGFPKFLKDQESIYGVDGNFVSRNIGLLCSEAVLPASSYATSEVKDNFIGVTQEFAHTRLYTDIDLVFYVDKDYKVLGFFEAWMDYISGGGEEPLSQSFNKPGYYRRFNYPDFYKTNGIYIKKFERDFATGGEKNVTYRLKNAFPKSMSSIPVAYGGADLLKVSVSFNYDYYYIYRRSAAVNIPNSIDEAQKIVKGLNPNLSDEAYKKNPNNVFATGLDVNFGGSSSIR